MSLLDSYIEKVAAGDFDTEREIELAKRAQAGDKLAYKQLAKLMSGTIDAAVSRSGVKLPNVSKDTLRLKAMGEFRRSVETFDPNAGAKLSSYIFNNINLSMSKIDEKYKNSSRVSAESTRESGNISSVMKQLDAEGFKNPTTQDIQMKLKENFGKDFSPEKIENLMSRQRRELSGGMVVGSPDEAEELNFGDLGNVDQVSGEDYIKAMEDKDILTGALGKLDDRSRNIYSQMKGIGDYEKIGPGKMSEVAKANDFNSEHFLKKEMARIESELGKILKNDQQ